MLTRLGFGLIWLLHFLPLPVLAACGRGLGWLFFRLGRSRRRVVLINLGLCFPEMPEPARLSLAEAHFAAFGRSLLERGILWWSSQRRIRRLVRVEGGQHLDALAGTPVILLTPHFVGLDMGWTRLSCDRNMVSVYANQRSAYVNRLLLRGRRRFGNSELLSRQAGIRPAIRAMREGLPFYYLPDMDYGRRDTIFVPFFAHTAATITGVSRLARMCGAAVVPCVTRMLDGGAGYVVKLYPAWDNFPGADIESDTRRMNAFIEERTLEMPEQYYWVHRRFKTRPPGESRPY